MEYSEVFVVMLSPSGQHVTTSVKVSRADSRVKRFIISYVSETNSISIIRAKRYRPDDGSRNVGPYKYFDAAVCPRKLY
jgi:hypothetical protein